MPSLFEFFAIQGEPGYISVDKLLDQLRKLDANYGEATAQTKTTGSRAAPPQETPEQKVLKQLSLFSAKIKDTLSKINEQTKKLGWSSE